MIQHGFDSIDEMIMSGNNYIIFDYYNKDLLDSDYNRDIILKFNENTRLYRLVTYLSYYKEPILRKNLPKKEFADKTGITGYQYMMYPEGDQKKRIYKKTKKMTIHKT